MSTIKFLIYDRSGPLASAIRTFLPQIKDGARCSIDTIQYNKDVAFAQVIADNQIDAIVSPGNSYGFLNGGFDALISSYYSGVFPNSAGVVANDITLCLQHMLRHQMGGYNPVTNAFIVDMTSALGCFPRTSYAALSTDGKKGIQVPQLIHVPTMSLPTVIPKGSPVVFNCMWNIICSINRNNASSEAAKISRVLLPGLGTGVGGVSAESCAMQMITALKLFAEADTNSDHELSYVHAAQIDRQMSRSVG